MRRLTIIYIILAIAYFVIGYGFVFFGLLKQDLYNQIATIVGGVASIFGLLGLIRPMLKSTDIKSIELETLKSLTKTAEEIQQKEAELSTKQKDITKLEIQKQELEFLVKKASLSLFYKEQLEKYYENLEKQVSNNKEMLNTITEIKDLEYKVEQLDVAINENPNAESILKIIEEARKKHTKEQSLITILIDGILPHIR